MHSPLICRLDFKLLLYLLRVVFCGDEVNDSLNELGRRGEGVASRAVQLHRWISYLLLENGVHLLT